jgi:hypothetical protein
MDIFLSAFDEVPDPRADNARHDLCELLVVGFVAVLCGATNCAEMAAFETRHFALSWTPTPEVFMATVRAHWEIEDALH